MKIKTAKNKELLKAAILDNDIMLAKQLIDSGTCSLKDFDDDDCDIWLQRRLQNWEGITMGMAEFLYEEARKVTPEYHNECSALCYARQQTKDLGDAMPGAGKILDAFSAAFESFEAKQRGEDLSNEVITGREASQYDEAIQDDF